MSNNTDKRTSWQKGKNEEPEKASRLAAYFSELDGPKRRRARLALVAMGKPAVPMLTEALNDPNEEIRWEAARALEQMQDSSSAGDENFGSSLRVI